MSTEIKGFTIEVRNNSIRFIPEDETYPWWRKHLDRQKDSILCPQILQHMQKIAFNLSEENDIGQRIGKYETFITNLPPIPKSSQGKKKTSYKNHLIKHLEKNSDKLNRFKDKDVLIYVAIYLRPKKFKTHDVDNFLKAIIDSLKGFIGDDNKVVSIFADKFQLINYPKEDFDFLEQVLIVITDPKARSEILKEI